MESPTEAPKSETTPATRHSSKRTNNFDTFTASYKVEEIKSGQYGSVTDEIKNLMEKKRKIFNSIYAHRTQVPELDQLSTPLASQQVSGLTNVVSAQSSPIIIIDSDDEKTAELTPFNSSHSIASAEPAVDLQINGLAETWSEKQKFIERHDDINETRKFEGPYPGRENDTPMDQNLQTDSNFTKVISDKETSDKESTCIGSDNPQKTEGNHQISLETQVVEDNRQIHFDNVMLVGDNGFEKDDPNFVDMEIDNDDTLTGNTCASVDVEIENDDTPIENVVQQINLDNTRFSGDSEAEDDAGNDQIVSDCDDLENIWNEMNFALECSKDIVGIRPEERVKVELHDCDHSFVLKEDLGYVCRVCGVIQRGIDTIIEYQFAKNTRSTRTYHREAPITDKEAHKSNDGSKLLGQDIQVKDFAIHPRHMKQMKHHQLEGFNFLQNNLVTDNPGGCILAHAPGSGKTFMIISFMQSFLAKYPQARPLVVLPKGILSTWKKEFNRWQVEDIPLYDFYSMKADSREQQLEVLKQWAGQKSILFLGYTQFSLIVCDDESNETTVSCQKFLLQYPSILILDEGHTPRTENTDVLSSLKKVQTPRKVVLSGTLYQNHVKEVFNIFDLVRPKFLKEAPARAIIRLCGKKHDKTNNWKDVFYKSVESTLQKDDDFNRKIKVIQDLREMTGKVLHFYKGDFLDDLPGLLDFTLFLNLSDKQKEGVKELKKINQRFKVISEGSALYVHPHLRNHLKSSSKKEREGLDDSKMDLVIRKLEISDGVKAKFFINLLGLCESTGEKLLVFGQYIQPLKFLERLIVKTKGWSVGKEIFVITGDSNSESRDSSMEQFNNSSTARLFFGSIKACGEGISLVGASRIIILDIPLNPSVTRQAIGRAFRPGQERKVYVYRLVAAESPEEDDHSTCFKKESIAKMWFEWNECCGQREFKMRSVDVRECGDEFLESPKLSEDIKSLYQR